MGSQRILVCWSQRMSRSYKRQNTKRGGGKKRMKKQVNKAALLTQTIHNSGLKIYTQKDWIWNLNLQFDFRAANKYFWLEGHASDRDQVIILIRNNRKWVRHDSPYWRTSGTSTESLCSAPVFARILETWDLAGQIQIFVRDSSMTDCYLQYCLL